MRGGRVPRSLKGECIAGARAAQALHEDSAHSRAHLLEGGLNPLAAGTRGGRQPDPQGGDGERPAGALRWAPSRRRAALPGAPHQGAAPRGAGRGAGSQSLAAPGPVVAPRSLLESRVRRGHRICTSNFPRLLCCPLETKQEKWSMHGLLREFTPSPYARKAAEATRNLALASRCRVPLQIAVSLGHQPGKSLPPNLTGLLDPLLSRILREL